MKKSDIVEGQHYVQSSAKELTGWRSYGNQRIVVVSNDDYTERSRSRMSLTQEALRQDPAYVKAHLAYSLCEAFEKDCTPNEKHAAAMKVRELAEAATAKWFAADPMRNFLQRSSRFDTTGVLARDVDDDGVVIDAAYLKNEYPDWEESKNYGYSLRHRIERDGLKLVPRREVRMTWSEYTAFADEAARQKAEAERRRKAAQAEADALRAELGPKLDAVFDKSNTTAPYLASYSTKVELSLKQLKVLLDAATGTEG